MPPPALSAHVLRRLAGQVCNAHEGALVFLLGGPGCGKGSVCERLARRGWMTLSAGALLRNIAENDAALRAVLERGEVVDASISAHAVLAHLAEQKIGPECRGTIIDGFPRNVDNAHMWQNIGAPMAPAIFLECSDDVVRNRLLKRGRADDKADVVDRRIQFHRQETPKIWDFFERKGLAVSVDGDGPIDQVCERVEMALRLPPFSEIGECIA